MKMTMLELIIREYIAIVGALEKGYEVENNRTIIDRENFKRMLETNAFATFTQKTKAYKDLNFIIHDNESYTMPYKDKESKKTVRKVIINYKTYLTVKKLYNSIANI